MKHPDPSISRIAATFGSRGRSPLYRWLWEHWSDLPAYKPLSWPDLTTALNEAGITGRDKQVLTADVVRKTYERVAAHKRNLPAAAQPPPPPSDQHTAARTTPKPVAASTSDDIRSLLSTGRKIPDPLNE